MFMCLISESHCRASLCLAIHGCSSEDDPRTPHNSSECTSQLLNWEKPSVMQTDFLIILKSS